MSFLYPVSKPTLNGNEKKYLLDCLNTNWISSNGVYSKQFEQKFAQYTNTKYALTCSNGTAALHLALMALDIKEDDEVLVPTLTFVASANAVKYCKAKPVFIDCDEKTWNLDVNKIEEKITTKTKAIIVVHLYGHPANMTPILKIAKKYNLHVIEDAAEALGATYKNKKIGSLGTIGTFSFFGNKIISTGEGGIITTDSDIIAAKIRLLRGQGMDSNDRYWHSIIGYNYRMTDLQAAIGCAQLENIDWHLKRRLEIANLYKKYLTNFTANLILPIEETYAKNTYWLYSILLKDFTKNQRNQVMEKLSAYNIETRPFFYPMHLLPPYKNLSKNSTYPVAEKIHQTGISLPTYATLNENDIKYISKSLLKIIN